MTSIVNGLVGGALVALATTVLLELVDDRLPVTPTVVESFVDHAIPLAWLRYLLQLLYGSATGGTLVALDLFVFGMLGVPPTTVEALGLAVVWSAALLLTVVVVSRFILENRLDRTSFLTLLAYHLLYGLGLGVWIRATWIT